MQKDKIIIALKKARSSIDRTIALIQEDDASTKKGACFAVMQQNLSAIGLLKSANALVLERHIDDVLVSSAKIKTSKECLALRDELVKIVTIAQKK